MYQLNSQTKEKIKDKFLEAVCFTSILVCLGSLVFIIGRPFFLHVIYSKDKYTYPEQLKCMTKDGYFDWTKCPYDDSAKSSQ
jgi:hypothetical protein